MVSGPALTIITAELVISNHECKSCHTAFARHLRSYHHGEETYGYRLRVRRLLSWIPKDIAQRHPGPQSSPKVRLFSAKPRVTDQRRPPSLPLPYLRSQRPPTAYEAVQLAMLAVLKSNTRKWAPILHACWRLRIPLIRHVLLMKLDYTIERRAISTRLLTVDARAGSAAALEKLRASAGFGMVIDEETSSVGPPLVMNLKVRHLEIESQPYEVRYVVKTAVDHQRITSVKAVDLGTSCPLYSHLLRVRVTGDTLESLCVVFNTPWRIQSTGYVTIWDDKPNSTDSMIMTVNSHGTDDDKEVETFIPVRTLDLLSRYNFPSEHPRFQFGDSLIYLVLCCRIRNGVSVRAHSNFAISECGSRLP